MRKPLIIYVSGAPGSGKTTLAKKISEALFIPHVSSDLVHGGVRLTQGAPNDRFKSFHEVFVPMMVSMAKMNVSFVVDQVLQEGVSKVDVIDKLIPFATIVYIHTYAHEPIDRHLARELARTDRGKVLDERGLRDRADFHRANLNKTVSPVNIGVKPLEVDTTDGYTPRFETIIDHIEQRYEDGHEKTN